MKSVELVEVTSANWRDVARLEVHPHQEEFVATPAYYLCLAQFGDDWNSLAIETDGAIVGHVMWAIDRAEDSTWLGGLVIDRRWQGNGLGRAAVQAFIDRFGGPASCHVALSYSPENSVARHLYQSLGFVETGEMEDGEIVARYRR